MKNIGDYLNIGGNIKPQDMPSYLGTDDPVVLKTAWNPISNVSFAHRLVRVNDDRLELRQSRGNQLLSILFFVAAVACLIMLVMVFAGKLPPDAMMILLIASLSFAGVGALLYFIGKRRIVIDKAVSALWKGKEEFSKVINPGSLDGYHSLKKVHAVQLLKRFSPQDNDSNNTFGDGDGNGFGVTFNNNNNQYTHEINLIFADGSRAALIAWSDGQAISNQAWAISDFLGIPLWDGRADSDLSSMLSDTPLGKPFDYAQNLLYYYSKFKAFAVFGVVALSLFFMFFGSFGGSGHVKQADTKAYLPSVTWKERQKLEPQYTAELFKLVKTPATVNVIAFDRLVNTGLDINAKDKQGHSPLYYAVMNKHYDYVNLLLSKGADIHVKDNNGKGLLDVIDKKGNASIYHMLFQAQLEENAQKRGKHVYYVSYKTLPDGTLVPKEIKEN